MCARHHKTTIKRNGFIQRASVFTANETIRRALDNIFLWNRLDYSAETKEDQSLWKIFVTRKNYIFSTFRIRKQYDTKQECQKWQFDCNAHTHTLRFSALPTKSTFENETYFRPMLEGTATYRHKNKNICLSVSTKRSKLASSAVYWKIKSEKIVMPPKSKKKIPPKKAVKAASKASESESEDDAPKVVPKSSGRRSGRQNVEEPKNTRASRGSQKENGSSKRKQLSRSSSSSSSSDSSDDEPIQVKSKTPPKKRKSNVGAENGEASKQVRGNPKKIYEVEKVRITHENSDGTLHLIHSNHLFALDCCSWRQWQCSKVSHSLEGLGTRIRHMGTKEETKLSQIAGKIHCRGKYIARHCVCKPIIHFLLTQTESRCQTQGARAKEVTKEEEEAGRTTGKSVESRRRARLRFRRHWRKWRLGSRKVIKCQVETRSTCSMLLNWFSFQNYWRSPQSWWHSWIFDSLEELFVEFRLLGAGKSAQLSRFD